MESEATVGRAELAKTAAGIAAGIEANPSTNLSVEDTAERAVLIAESIVELLDKRAS